MDTRKVQALFSQLTKKMTNTKQPMREIAAMLTDSVEENFAVEGRPRWQKLADARIAQRKKAGTWPSKILTETGLLAASITYRSTNTSAIVGSNLRYAATHQLGRPEKNIPARPFLAIQPEDIESAEKILIRHLNK